MCGVTKPSNAPVIVMIYVDDLLVGSISTKGIDDVRNALQETLKVRTTGSLTNASGAGGTIVFLGRHIIRPAGTSEILLRVPPEYLKELFTNDPFCCELKPSDKPPDLLGMLEAGVKDPKLVEPLSDEAAARYKRIIGKLSWSGQSRPDHARFLSILATGQATPTNLHENALRKYLRYVRSQLHLFQRFPAGKPVLPEYDELSGVSDASWGSSDLENRRSTSGGLIFWKGSMIKGYSRLQGCITLSSCEAEIIAVCQLAQECLGVRHVTEFLESFGDRNMLLKLSTKEFQELKFDEISNLGDHYPIVIFTDSQACIGALNNQGLSRRVRHMSIAVCYIQALKDCGNLTIEWLPGSKCTADLLTKVLPVEVNNFHRSQIGILEIVGQEEWQLVINKELKKKGKKSDVQTTDVQDEIPSTEDLATFSAKKGLPVEGLESFENLLQRVGIEVQAGKVTHVIVELCTSSNAGLSQGIDSTRSSSCAVIPITKEIDLHRVSKVLVSWIVCLKELQPGVVFLGWASPPCTGGSPVLHLIQQPRRGEIQSEHLKEFEDLMIQIHQVLTVCQIRVLEMSQRCSYWKDESVQSFCRVHEMRFVQDIARCAYVNEKVPALHQYRLVSSRSLFMPKECNCKNHMSLNDQHLGSLGE